MTEHQPPLVPERQQITPFTASNTFEPTRQSITLFNSPVFGGVHVWIVHS